MQAGLRRADGYVKDVGGIRERQAEEEMHDDDRARVGCQSGQRAVHLVARDDLLVDSRDRKLVVGRELDLDDASSAPPKGHQAGADEHAMEPCVEPVGITQAREVAPREHRGVLDCVTRELGVAEDQAGSPVQARKPRAQEGSERVPVASPGAFHERSIIHSHPPETARSATTLASYGAAIDRTVPRGGGPRPLAIVSASGVKRP